MLQNKNLEIKILQLQFQGQTSELCLSLCSEKQNEIHSLIESLEEKYKTLLAAADAAIEKQQREYLMVYFIYYISPSYERLLSILSGILFQYIK